MRSSEFFICDREAKVKSDKFLCRMNLSFTSNILQWCALFAMFNLKSIMLASISSEEMAVIKSRILKNYDKDIIPTSQGQPVDVKVAVYLNDMVPMGEKFMQYSLDIFLRLQWRDYRLAYNNSSIPYLPFDSGFYSKIWVPTIYFPRSKDGFKHTIILPNILAWLYADGTIFTGQRISLSTYCPMDLVFYPFDIQKCDSAIEPYAYNADYVRVFWESKYAVEHPHNLRTTDFSSVDITTSTHNKGYGSRFGNYSRLVITLTLHRNLNLHLLRDFFPCILIVMLSWISFWINYRSTPARVALGITTVLTVVTISNDVRDNAPEVGLFRSIDYYMLFCNLFVFAGLCEYALVGMTLPHLKKMKKTEKDDESAENHWRYVHTSLSNGTFTRPTRRSCDHDKKYYKTKQPSCRRKRDNSLEEEDGPTDKHTSFGPFLFYADDAHFIDKFSRVVFPVCFGILNLVFYLYHLYHPEAYN